MNPTTVDAGAPLTPRDVVAVARLGAQVTVGEDAIERVKRASDLVESLADDPTPHYGISTGFGALASTGCRVTTAWLCSIHSSVLTPRRPDRGSRARSSAP
ncbi:histidine ammonia-lyase [Cutibacterium acnes JCM 18918]|nr:histidine ammonia-lyase [Cutibacterium acnes JCM 18918]